ncbi:MAG TPA: DUF3501 family protein [Gemmataceae bacterium]|nr:DUF3501 family protein [Gemmataceae bacterium]
MRALTLDDLLPLEEYASQRREHFDALMRYLDRYRRVRVGPRLTLLFENRQTLWFRVQELLRVARLADPARVQQELDVYNRLLPGPDRLQAALLIDVADETRLGEELAAWQSLRGDDLLLCLGPRTYPANLLTCRPEDRCIGTAHWVQFVLDRDARRALGDARAPAHFRVTLPAYSHESPPLGDEVRQSLLEDLALSDRDAA